MKSIKNFEIIFLKGHDHMFLTQRNTKNAKKTYARELRNVMKKEENNFVFRKADSSHRILNPSQILFFLYVKMLIFPQCDLHSRCIKPNSIFPKLTFSCKAVVNNARPRSPGNGGLNSSTPPLKFVCGF